MILAQRRALVTGGAAGIGRRIAEVLAGAGARVAVGDLDAAGARAVAGALDRPDASAVGFGVDVADFAQVQTQVAQAIEALGGLDILVNNAGVTRDGLFLRMAEPDWDLVLNVNLKGAFNVCRACARALIRSPHGRIINISSIVGLRGNAGQVNYAASKAGLVGLTKSLAREFAGRAVTVNAIAPGYIATPMTDALPAAVKDEYRRAIPLGSFGTPDDVAACCLFLASSGARYVTGQVLTVDGGLAM